MAALSGLDWTLLLVAAALVGFAKTAVGGVAAVAVAVFAAVLPARESTGALLPLLLVGDVVAVGAYRRHADWPRLLRLLPSVAAGVVAGTVFMASVDDVVMRRTIGAVLLTLVVVHVGSRGLRRRLERGGHGPAAAFGLLAGFTTMVANAGGAVMSLYLLSARLSMLVFLGTASWFFFVVNVVKVPFSVGLGLVTADSLVLDLLLAPAVLAGAALGRRVVGRLDQAQFERLVLAFTVVSSLNLLR